MLRAEVQNVLRGQITVGIERDIGHLAQLPQPVFRDAVPGLHPRQPGFKPKPAAEILRPVCQRHAIAAPRQRQRRLQPRRATAHHKHRTGTILAHPFRVPAAPPFLACRRVLGAAHPDAIMPAGNADVAADAFADLRLAALVDLGGQEGVGDRGARAADEIQHAAPDHPHHGIGRGEAAHADHGFVGKGFDEIHHGFMAAFRGEARGGAVGSGIVHLHVKQVRRVTQQGDHLVPFAGGHLGRAGAQLLHRQAQRHGTAPVGGLAHGIDQLFHQPHAVTHRPAIGIGAVIVVAHQELIGQIAHADIDIKDVKARAFGAHCRLGVPADQVADIGGIHDPGARGGHEADMRGHPGHARRRQHGRARGAVHRRRPAMPQFHPRQRAMGMDGVGHHRMGAHISLVPQGGTGEGGNHPNSGPPNRPRCRPRPSRLRPSSPGMRRAHVARHWSCRWHGHLEKAVLCQFWPDAHRLEQGVIARIAGHGQLFIE